MSEADSQSPQLQEEARLEEDEHERAFWDNPLQELVSSQLCIYLVCIHFCYIQKLVEYELPGRTWNAKLLA